MSRRAGKPRRPSKGGGTAGLVVVCLLFVGFGLYTSARGIGALEAGTLVPATPRSGPMSGTTAIIIGAGSILAGGFGLWLVLGGPRRRH